MTDDLFFLKSRYFFFTFQGLSLGSLTWRVALNDRMVVHLESGIATTACEAHNMVLAIIYNDSGLIDGDVICPYIEYDANLSLFLQNQTKKRTLRTINPKIISKCESEIMITLLRRISLFFMPLKPFLLGPSSFCCKSIHAAKKKKKGNYLAILKLLVLPKKKG